MEFNSLYIMSIVPDFSLVISIQIVGELLDKFYYVHGVQIIINEIDILFKMLLIQLIFH